MGLGAWLQGLPASDDGNAVQRESWEATGRPAAFLSDPFVARLAPLGVLARAHGLAVMTALSHSASHRFKSG